MKFRDPSTEGGESDSDEELTELSLDPGAGYDSTGGNGSGNGSGSASQQASPAGSSGDRRAHHNMLERKRRDHIKDSFLSLKDSVPTLSGEKASRTQILRKACDYIEAMRDKIAAHNADIGELRDQNQKLEAQVRGIEDAAKAMRSAASIPKRPNPLPPVNKSGHDYVTKPGPGDAPRIIRVSMPSNLIGGSLSAPISTNIRLSAPPALTPAPNTIHHMAGINSNVTHMGNINSGISSINTGVSHMGNINTGVSHLSNTGITHVAHVPNISASSAPMNVTLSAANVMPMAPELDEMPVMEAPPLKVPKTES